MQIYKGKTLEFMVVFLVMMVIQAIYSISISPIYQFEGFDAGVYEYMGFVWKIGKIPYYDLFEGKGPLIFFINAIGWWINDRGIGIYLLQCLNYTFIYFLWKRIAELFVSGWKSILAVVLTFVIYLIFNEEGNLTEDWCMLPISYSMYLLARMVRDERTPRLWEYFIAGLGAGAVTMIRMNNMPITVVLACYTLYYLVKAKDYRRLCLSALVMFVGFLLPILAFYVYFYVRWGSLGTEWFMYGTFWYNFDYAANHNGADAPILSRVIYWASVAVLLLASRRVILEEKKYLVLGLILYVFSYMVMGKSLYIHYFMTVLPIIVVSAALALAYEDKVIWMVLFACLIADVCTGISDMKYLSSNGDIYPPDYYTETDKLIERIPLADRDSIFNYNDEFCQLTVLKRHKIMQCNRLALKMNLTLSRKLHDETCNQLFEKRPKWLIASHNWDSARDSIFLSKNYHLVYVTQCDMSKDWYFCHGQMKLYRRNR